MSDLVTTRIFTDGEKGITAAKLNDIVASSTIQTDFVATKPVASTMDPADNLLVLKSSGQYAKAPFQTIVDSVNTQLPSNDAEIWSVRLRSFNAAGNPNFECCQRNVSTTITGPTVNTFIEDRWSTNKAATATLGYSIGRVTTTTVPSGGVLVPGTNFAVSNSMMRVTLTTAQATLAGGDYLRLLHNIEGSVFRELMSDVFSISLLVRSSVSNLKFGVSIVSADSGKSLTKLCTIPAANTWTLITLPNCAIWPAGGVFNVAPGSLGCFIEICLAAGATNTAPAADTWQNAHFMMPPGASNFANSAVNSTYDLGFLQIEPGAVCSTLMDKPFSQNLDECLRYYCKSYGYGVAPGTTGSNGFLCVAQPIVNWGSIYCHIPFKKVMSKAPNVIAYSMTTGAPNTVRDNTNSVDRATIGALAVQDGCFGGMNITGQVTTGNPVYYFHYTADTGW